MSTIENVRVWDVSGAQPPEGPYKYRRNVYLTILATDIQAVLDHFTEKYPGVEVFQIINRSASKTVEVAK